MKKKKEKKPEAAEQLEVEAEKVEKSESICDLDELQEKLETLEKDNEELTAKLQRLSADYANYQKRVPKQIEDSVSYKVESFVKAILPSIDNFDHALAAMNNDDTESIIKGVQLVHDHLIDILKAQGLEQVCGKGEQFDPSVHQAMMQQYEEGVDDNVILEVFQKGYVMNGKTIRPSSVIVNKLSAKAEPASEDTEVEDDNTETEE